MNAVPLSAGDVVGLIGNIVRRTYPANQTELYQALNYGLGKAVRALSAVRPQHFASFLDPFTIQPNVKEYDISTLNPPLLRPSRLIVNGNSGQGSVILFAHRDMMARDFEDAEVSVSGISSTLYYDVLEGMLPSTTTTATMGVTTSPSTALAVLDTTLLQTGALLTLPIGGAGITPAGWAGPVPQPYQGFVLKADTLTGPGNLQIDPPIGATVPDGVVVTPVRQRILFIVPPVGQSYAGRLWYVYAPPRMAVDSDLFPPALVRHVDMVVAYGLAFLKRGVDDAMEARWQLDAVEMRAELMQDADPMSSQNSDALGSDLDAVAGY